MRHLVYSVRYSVVPINSSLLTVTLHYTVITTLVYNDTKIQSLSWCYNRVRLLLYVCIHAGVWMRGGQCQIFESKPDGRRKMGSPRLRWLEDGEKDLREIEVTRWRHKAVDRKGASVIKETKAVRGAQSQKVSKQGRTASRIHNLGTSWKWIISLTPRPL
jgi:hypothetical protein